MMDENDDGARVGLWVVIGIITLLLFGLIGGLAIRSMHAKQPAAKPVAAAAATADVLLDAPLSGEVVGRLFFELRSEEHTSELQSQSNLVCRLLLEKKKK